MKRGEREGKKAVLLEGEGDSRRNLLGRRRAKNKKNKKNRLVIYLCSFFSAKRISVAFFSF